MRLKPKKKTWLVTGVVSAGKFIGKVEAETEEEAKRLGYEHENCYASTCHHCAKHFDSPEIVSIEVELENG